MLIIGNRLQTLFLIPQDGFITTGRFLMSAATRSFLRNREFAHYPTSSQRLAMLVLAIVATIALYYQSALLGAVFPLMITSLGISLQAFTYVVIALVVLGALASLFGNLADRFGRVRFVTGGLL